MYCYFTKCYFTKAASACERQMCVVLSAEVVARCFASGVTGILTDGTGTPDPD